METHDAAVRRLHAVIALDNDSGLALEHFVACVCGGKAAPAGKTHADELVQGLQAEAMHAVFEDVGRWR